MSLGSGKKPTLPPTFSLHFRTWLWLWLLLLLLLFWCRILAPSRRWLVRSDKLQFRALDNVIVESGHKVKMQMAARANLRSMRWLSQVSLSPISLYFLSLSSLSLFSLPISFLSLPSLLCPSLSLLNHSLSSCSVSLSLFLCVFHIISSSSSTLSIFLRFPLSQSKCICFFMFLSFSLFLKLTGEQDSGQQRVPGSLESLPVPKVNLIANLYFWHCPPFSLFM